MLKLNRLELSGFKSFVEPVSINVAGGLTAIVGPNGCGKSNIADAVVWVLGERSAKSLRGEKMEDVIFAGTKDRQPLGMAEVQLELSSDNGFKGADDGRLSIGRRVFRSGESQYLLNGRTVRLKDVRDLLMDTGLGIRAYSMIEQGKIGMILSGKPQERRRLLEEAAGITRYRERRRLAELKLEEASANLARLDDIVSEVERSLRSLRRQAGAARRFQKRQEEHRELRRRVLEGRWSKLDRGLAEFRRRIQELAAGESEETAALTREEAALAEGREQLEELGRRLGLAHRKVADLAAAVEGRQEFLKGSRERLEEIAERVGAGRAVAAGREKHIVELEAAREELEGRRAAVLSDRDRAAGDVTDDEQRISRVESLVAEAEQALESLRGRLLGSINDLAALRNRLHQEQIETEKGGLRKRHLDEEIAQHRRDLEEATAALAEARAKTGEIEEEVEQRRQALEEQRGELERLSARREELAGRHEELGGQLAALEQRRVLLAELAEEHQQRREELLASLRRAGLDQPRFLAERLEVPDGWARSLDLYLGGLEDAVVLPPEADALELARSLAGGGASGRLLSPIAAHPVEQDELVAEGGVGLSLGEALGLPPEIAAALPPAYLVDSPDDAQRLARRHRGVAFITDSRLWAQNGILHLEGERAAPGPLARRRELGEVAARLEPLGRELAEATAELERLTAAIRIHQGRLGQQDQELAEARQRLAVVTARRDDLEARHRRLELERDALVGELEEVDGELALVAQRRERLAGELERGRLQHAELESAFDAAQKAVDEARSQRESTRTTGASRRGHLELLEERLRTHLHEAARLEGEIEEERRALASWSEESAALERRQGEIRTAIGEAETALQQALEERVARQDDAVAEQERLDAKRAELREAEARVAEIRQRRDDLRSRIGELRIEEAGLRQDAEHLRETFLAEFDDEPAEEPGEPPAELAEMEADLERLKAILERLGPVNLLAAEEYDEQAERHEFLTTQRADVVASVARLRATIQEINETSSRRFRVTFEQVNEQFGTIFADLFRGGEAHMRILDEDDVLESVIEIVARPPGKRLQNIMLLSGGEKALTAIALLFALFKAKPSPFCILDEVDAPLDDINTLRFVELLRKMSAETQFVVITHNKLTMEAASMLYGVTMQERGVSDVVAVELDDVQPAAAADAAAASA